MNKDVVKVLKDEKLKRTQHPYWIRDSIQEIPNMLSACRGKELVDAVAKAAAVCTEKKLEAIHLLGRGSSYFLTLAGKPLLQQLTGIPTHASVTNVFSAYEMDGINHRSLVILHSHSGKTEEDLNIMRRAKELGATTMAITDYADSPLAQIADIILVGPGGAKVELPATRSYATTLYLLHSFSIVLAKSLKSNTDTGIYIKAMAALPAQIARMMDAAENICSKAVRQLADSSSYIVIGYGPNFSTADEAALSISQSAAVPAFSFELENFIHGPIQALTPTQTVICIAPEGALQERMLRTLQAARTIGSRTVLLTPEDHTGLPDSDVRIDLPAGIPELISPLTTMVPLWQFAYQLALLGGGSHPDRLAMDRPEFQEAFTYLL
ncbi:MAG: SIS domain-containing protein [Anaerolineales bacterium]|nr:SIS domain-containing protein [Anaerolineales bacterium]